jgi:catechol 2,3-dioxygenase-like lactoylglutathione lyase family enzyme
MVNKGRGILSRREALGAIGMATAGAFFPLSMFGQGRCADGYGTAACPLTEAEAIAPIKAVFAPTGWRTTALEQVTFLVADYEKEAAFYNALMGWNVRSDDGKQAVLDIGDWGSAIFRQSPVPKATVSSFGFVIEHWDTKAVEAELRKRGLDPVREDGEKGFVSFHVKDPDGFDLQICNDKGLSKERKSPAHGKLSAPPPFDPTGWKTIWLDHGSFGVTNYKESVSFYSNLLGWKPTGDEGSLNLVAIGDVGDIIMRGGNPKDPKFDASAARHARIDHISFGITPWDTDGVKAELEKRGLKATLDTGTKGDDRYKSYHTITPNGYNLQMSNETRATRLNSAHGLFPTKPAGA